MMPADDIHPGNKDPDSDLSSAREPRSSSSSSPDEDLEGHTCMFEGTGTRVPAGQRRRIDDQGAEEVGIK